MTKKICILGATSHVAQGLIYYLKNNKQYELYLFSRIPININWEGNNIKKDFIDNFNNYDYDVIINCVYDNNSFFISEKYDNLIIEKLIKKPETIYINFSSGAVYGKDFSKEVNSFTQSTIDMNNLNKTDNYYINKIYMEMKHRSFHYLNIVDIRLFSYFSRFISLDSNYFLTEITRCIKDNKEFITDFKDMVRDYIDPYDLFQLIECCINNKKINSTFDTYSLSPVSKSFLLEVFEKEYKLKIINKEGIQYKSNTGNKNVYYSINNKAEVLGYFPKFSSKETILNEIEHILDVNNL
jgi:nucleoside-diphosphate-sugar epimerase